MADAKKRIDEIAVKICSDVNEGCFKIPGTINVGGSVLPSIIQRLDGVPQKVKLEWHECTLIHKGDHTYKYESQARMEVKDPEKIEP